VEFLYFNKYLIFFKKENFAGACHARANKWVAPASFGWCLWGYPVTKLCFSRWNLKGHGSPSMMGWGMRQTHL
jgi:hypothetical protein